jgi:hypothetical protein
MVDEALWRCARRLRTAADIVRSARLGRRVRRHREDAGDRSVRLGCTRKLWRFGDKTEGLEYPSRAAFERRPRTRHTAVVLDPRRTGLAKKAALHVPVWPGADLAIALALIAEAERRGRAADGVLERHTKHAELLFAEARKWTLAGRRAKSRASTRRPSKRLADDELTPGDGPVTTRIGWGLERNRNGDGAMAAILALPAVFGHFGCAAAATSCRNRARGKSMQRNSPASRIRSARAVNMSQLAEALRASEPPPRALGRLRREPDGVVAESKRHRTRPRA